MLMASLLFIYPFCYNQIIHNKRYIHIFSRRPNSLPKGCGSHRKTIGRNSVIFWLTVVIEYHLTELSNLSLRMLRFLKFFKKWPSYGKIFVHASHIPWVNYLAAYYRSLLFALFLEVNTLSKHWRRSPVRECWYKYHGGWFVLQHGHQKTGDEWSRRVQQDSSRDHLLCGP